MITYNIEYIINYVLPAILEQENKSRKLLEKINSFEDFVEFNTSISFLRAYQSYIIYVKQLYDIKESKIRASSVNLVNIENLLSLNAYLSLSTKKYEKGNSYWSKINYKHNDKTFLLYIIILKLAEYIYYLDDSGKK